MMDTQKDVINTSQHVPYLDGSRGLAILIVVLSHAGLGHIIPGKFGVTFFFFISGYLITKLLLLELAKKGHIQIRNFYLRRFFRLYPALLAMILLSLFTAVALDCSLPGKDVWAALFYFTNYYIGWIRPPVADCSSILDIIWSLSVEEHFYFFFPFLTSFFLGKQKTTYSTVFISLLLLLCAAALGARIWLYTQYPNDLSYASGRIYFSTHTRMDSILWGCVAAYLLYKQSSTRYLHMLHSRIFFLLGILLLFLSVAIRAEAFRQTLLFTFQGVGLLLIIPALQFNPFEKLRKLMELPVLLFIGRISYSLYLFHWVAAKAANNLTTEHSWQWQLIFWPLAVGLAVLSYNFVEKPFVSIRRRFGSAAHESQIPVDLKPSNDHRH